MAFNLKQVVQSNVKSFTESIEGKANKLVDGLKQQAFDALDPTGIFRGILGKVDSTPPDKTTTAASDANSKDDWRVKLSLPGVNGMAESPILKPLKESGGLVFPYTPTILIQHTASYDSLQPVHSNYPFHIYQNSQIEDIVITGDFFCENAVDAQYWTAMVHYLRTVTKMSYGQSPNAGAPPPIVRLNGYGDFVFPNVPVIVKNFTVDLPADVDYIKTQITGDVGITSATTNVDIPGKVGWAPTQSQVAVTVSPIYSRAKTSSFNLKTFVDGGYLGTGQSGGGFV
jgi:hypothetical protein